MEKNKQKGIEPGRRYSGVCGGLEKDRKWVPFAASTGINELLGLGRINGNEIRSQKREEDASEGVQVAGAPFFEDMA